MTNDHATGPNSNGRKSDGRFAQGNRLSPGRPPGARGKAALLAEQLIDADCAGIVEQLVTAAKGGDVAAAKVLLDRLLPAKRDRHIEYQLSPINSAADAAAAINHILAGVGAGELTASEGDALVKMVESAAKVIEISLLEARVAALEGART
jgi:hypothetical protein